MPQYLIQIGAGGEPRAVPRTRMAVTPPVEVRIVPSVRVTGTDVPPPPPSPPDLTTANGPMIFVNGTDLNTLGFVATTRRFPRLGGESTVVSEVPGAAGGFRTGGVVRTGTLRVEGWVRAPDHAGLHERLDALTALLAGECVIRFADLPGREWVGWLQQESASVPIAPDWITQVEQVTLEWMLADPAARAPEETVAASAPLPAQTGFTVAAAAGTAPSAPTVTVANGSAAAVTRVEVEVQRADGAPLDLLAWNGTLAPGASLVVDAGAFRVTDGSGANRLAGLTPESVFPRIDPREGAARVVVRVGGGGGHVVTVAYRKRWW